MILLRSQHSRGELGGERSGETVGNIGVGQVVQPVLNRSLAGDDGLHVESEHGEHSQSSVLDLLHLKFKEGVGVVSKAKGVEVVTTGVERVKTLSGGTTTNTVSLNGSHQDHLDSKDSKDGLCVHQGGVAKVVKTLVREDLST